MQTKGIEMFVTKEFLARSRIRFLLGSSMAGITISLMGILTFSKVWEQTFQYYNIPMVSLYIILPVGYMVLCWVIGLWYEQSGMWGAENSHINNNMNPEFLKVCRDIELIKQKLGIEDEVNPE